VKEGPHVAHTHSECPYVGVLALNDVLAERAGMFLPLAFRSPGKTKGIGGQVLKAADGINFGFGLQRKAPA